MSSKSIDGSISVSPSINPALNASTVTGAAVDLAGYEGAEIIVVSGTITDGTHTISLTECDTSGGSYTAVAAGDIIGSTPVLDTTAAHDNATWKFGYKGSKRYIKVVSTITGSPGTGGIYGALVLKTHARHSTS